jgi:CBS domain-containing protein
LRTIDVSQIRGFGEVLQNITAQRLAYENWTRKKLVLVGANQPVERALSRINTHNILSLPVVDDSNSNGAVVGLLDVLDIIAALSETWETTGRPQRREILFIPISEVMAKKKRPTFLVSISTPVHEVIKQFAEFGIKRVMIVDRTLEKNFCQQEKPEEMVVGLLTESDLVRFVAENIMWIKKEKLFQQTLRDLNLGNRLPITVDQNIQAFQAFLEIHKNGGEGAAMVDANGKLIANVSASNIKGMTRRNFQLLWRALMNFLSRDRKRGWWHLPVCTTLDSTLESVILQFVATKVHRMYITDDEGKPVGEISLSDVIYQLAAL